MKYRATKWHIDGTLWCGCRASYIICGSDAGNVTRFRLIAFTPSESRSLAGLRLGVRVPSARKLAASRGAVAQKYLEDLRKRIDCKNPEPAIAWLKKQPHVRSVEHDGCTVFLLVDGATPVWLF